ncbi:MAG: PilZ domain-containing protein [Oligoflexales bacterium]|nr:PilZ domain-containing protein [Oligoflexales bacterium]
MSNITEKSQGSVADYLDGPKKKQKHFILLALSETIPSELKSAIESYLKNQFKNFQISRPKNSQELMKSIKRQIKVLIVDDEFSPLDETIENVKKFKEKHYENDIPVLFLSRNPALLIENYHNKLLMYQESDDYVQYSKLRNEDVLNKIKNIINGEHKRRSRRYKLNIPVTYYQFRYNRVGKGFIVDLSMHGALLKGESDHIFEGDEQIKISMPIRGFVDPASGEYLSLATRVKRIFIAGSKVGLSFEYMNEDKITKLSEFLVNYVAKTVGKMRPVIKKEAS